MSGGSAVVQCGMTDRITDPTDITTVIIHFLKPNNSLSQRWFLNFSNYLDTESY